MCRLTDKILLLICCLFMIALIPWNTSFIVGFFLIITISSTNYFFYSMKYSLSMSILYMIVMLIFPSCGVFFAVVFYDLLYWNAKLAVAMLFLSSICYLPHLPFVCLVYFGLCCSIAYLLHYKTKHYNDLEKNFRKIRDDSKELNLLLNDKNRALLEKQDSEIYTATLRERNRIAREIHDNVGHMLSRSILMVGALKAMNQDYRLAESLQQLDVTLSSAMDNIRESVHDLHDDSVNLREAIQGLIDGFTFCKISYVYDMQLDLPKALKYCFISITKEALSNIMKHSYATQVYVTMREHPGLYQLIIQDNGSGVSQNFYTNHGIGLVNMRERIQQLNGTLQLHTTQGFQIFITIPKERIG